MLVTPEQIRVFAHVLYFLLSRRWDVSGVNLLNLKFSPYPYFPSPLPLVKCLPIFSREHFPSSSLNLIFFELLPPLVINSSCCYTATKAILEATIVFNSQSPFATVSCRVPSVDCHQSRYISVTSRSSLCMFSFPFVTLCLFFQVPDSIFFFSILVSYCCQHFSPHKLNALNVAYVSSIIIFYI